MQMSFLDFVGEKKEVKTILCGECSFDLNISQKEYETMYKLAKIELVHRCTRCQKGLYVCN